MSKAWARLVAWLVVLCACSGVTIAQRGFGPTMTPSKLRSIPAETTAAKAKDPNWKVPRTAWGQPDLSGIWTSDDMRGVPATRPPAQKDRESGQFGLFAKAKSAGCEFVARGSDMVSSSSLFEAMEKAFHEAEWMSMEATYSADGPDGSDLAVAVRASGRHPAVDRASDPGSGSAGPGSLSGWTFGISLC